VSDHPACLLVLLDANKEGIKEFIAIIIDTGKFPTNVEITIV
jgi:hypothetical protein